MKKSINFEERPKGWTMIHGNLSTFSEGTNYVRENVCESVYKQIKKTGKANCVHGEKPECKDCFLSEYVS